MSKNWLISLIAFVSISSLSLPVRGQAVLPYVPKLDSKQLESQGLQLFQDAVQLIRFEQYDLALPRAELASQLAPENYDVWFILGTLYVRQDKIDQGINALRKAESIAPEQEGVLFRLGEAYFQQGDYQTAQEKLEAGLEIKNDPNAWFILGNTYLKLAKFDEAIDAYQEAVTLEKTFWPALNNVGLVEYERGDRDQAISQWKSVIKVNKKQAEPKLALAVALFNEGKVDEAIKLGQAALAIDGRYADIKFLQENLWGEQLIQDTRQFLNDPQMQKIVSNIKPSDPEQLPAENQGVPIPQ